MAKTPPKKPTPAKDQPAAQEPETPLLVNVEGESPPASDPPAADIDPDEGPAKPAIVISPEELEAAKTKLRQAALARMEAAIEKKASATALKMIAKAQKKANRVSKPGKPAGTSLYREAQVISRPVHLAFSAMLKPFPQENVLYKDKETPVNTSVKIVGLDYLEAYSANGKTIKGSCICVDLSFDGVELVTTGETTAEIPKTFHILEKFGPGQGIPWALIGLVATGQATVESSFSFEDAATYVPVIPPKPEKPAKVDATPEIPGTGAEPIAQPTEAEKLAAESQQKEAA